MLLLTEAGARTRLNISNSPAWPSVSPRLATDGQGGVHLVWDTLLDIGNGEIFGWAERIASAVGRP